MHVDERIDYPDRMAEPLQAFVLLPLRALGLVNLKLDFFSHRVSAPSEYQHEGAYKGRGMLISSERLLGIGLVRSADPVPPAVSVAAETPSVLEGHLIVASSAENYHHPICRTQRAEGSRVIDSDAGCLAGCFELSPGKGRLVNVQAPDVVHGLGSRVPSEDQQEGF